MTHHAKAPSAGSTDATGNSRGLLRRAFATRGATRGSKGSGAPAVKLLGLLAISLIALFATAAFATAAPLSAQMGTVSNPSYTSAHVTGKYSTPPPNCFGNVSYSFQYSTDEANWTTATTDFLPGEANEKEVEANISVPKGGTKYFVRLAVSNCADPEVTSPGPNPSFTTLAVEQPIIVTTDDASELFSTSAKASGKVKRPANSDSAFNVTACRFEYVTDADFTATGFAGASQAPCAEVSPEAPLTEPNEGRAVTAQLGCANPLLPDPDGKCLKPGTTYHLRLAAENAAPVAATKAATSTFTTLPAVAKPVVIAANDATDVGKRTAKVTGEIERPAGADPALDTACRFEYVTDEQFTATGFDGAGQAPCVEATPETPLTSPAPGYPAVSADVSAELSGLSSGPTGVTYHLRLAAENGGGTETKVAAGTFTTLPIIPASVTIDSITEVGYQKARVNATADPGNQGLYREIEYALAGTEEWFGTNNVFFGVGLGSVSAGAPPLQFSKPFGPGGCTYDDLPPQNCAPTGSTKYGIQPGPGLKPGTTYKVRGGWRDLEAIEGQFTYHNSPEPYPEFTTKGTSAPPIASLDPITTFTGASAHFTGTVDPNVPAEALDDEAKAAYKTKWHFECTPECKDPNGNPIGGTVETEGGAQAIVADVKRLDANTQYEVRLIAENGAGTGESIQTFNTPLIKPTVKAAPGGSDGKGGYTLQGIVNPNNSPVTSCKFEWGPNSADYAFTADCSPAPGDKAQPVTVEASLTGLNPGVVYHYNLLATNGAGTAESGDQEFTPTLAKAEPCANEQLRIENSSLALPECRAYEKVTPDGKEGFDATLTHFDGGERAAYIAGPNIAKSGQNALESYYVATRAVHGWQTIPNLNGPDGSLYAGPDSPSVTSTPGNYSSDLRMSLWDVNLVGGAPGMNFYLRNPDGSFTLIGASPGQPRKLVSADLSHLLVWPPGSGNYNLGTGAYEYVGTGVDQPRRVDVDNSGAPITACGIHEQSNTYNAYGKSISGDGRVITLLVVGGCGGANPPANEIWARVNGTTSFDVSASQCDRVTPACNAPANVTFEASTPDGSRVFFATTQQLLNGDTDQTRDIYACDIPSGNPAPTTEKANHCAAFTQVSGAQAGAAVENVYATSDNGAAVWFTAKGVLADNEDAFKEKAVADGHNLYVWRTDAAHPAGQTTFVARLDSDDLDGSQTTPDGRYLVFTTANQLLDTDTDTARDVYRYDAVTEVLTRASTNVFGTAGNGNGFDAEIRTGASFRDSHHSHAAVSDDGQKIVFITIEALSPVDGNAEPDLYLWTPDRVSLISPGSVGEAVISGEGNLGNISIDGSGQSIYFETPGALIPADGDDIGDVYVARVGGGFSSAPAAPCSGEGCQPDAMPAPAKKSPSSVQPSSGNPPPRKACPKGKTLRKGKCVKKKPKKHSGKKHRGKKAAHKQGGGK